MAGGKETPRQKMIGMMYLVLTALLALNVSKSILEAFVSMDNNIQAGTRSIQARGTEAVASLEQVYNGALDKKETKRAEAAKEWLDKAKEVQELTKVQIEYIQSLKDQLITDVDAKIDEVKFVNDNGIIVYDLSKIDAKDNYDKPMAYLVGPEIKTPNEVGMTLWNNMMGYRNNLVTLLSTYKKNSLDAASLEGKELNNETRNDLLGSVHKDDRVIVASIYNQLTKEEFSEVHEVPDVHWVGRTFDHAPVVAALAQLSALEQETRTAESMALAHIRGKVGGSDYSFNKVIALAHAPSNYFNSGDSIEVQVMMAAYDSYNQPKVMYKTDSTSAEFSETKDIRGGKGFIALRADGAGKKTVKGILEIKKKDGSPEQIDWQFDYTVGKPSGVVSLPEMFTLYRGYQNKVVGAVTGYTDYRLSMSGGSISRKGAEWIASPSKGVRKAKITITGIAADGSSASLGAFDFDVRQMPSPSIYVGKKTNGQSASKQELAAGVGRLFARYDESIPLKAKFSITKWEVRIEGMRAPVKGSGANASKAARGIRAVPKGGTVAVKCWVRYPSGLIKPLMSTIIVK